MTTELQPHRSGGVATLLGATCSAVGAGALVAVLALAVAGGGAAGAALAGAALALVVMAFGAFAVDLVATVMPAASLLVALLTYALQLVLMTVLLTAASDVDALAGHGRAGWLVAAVVAVVLVWTLSQLVLASRRRIPAYDVALPGEARSADVRVSVR
ncbi:hypothetical protein AB3X52_15175 [Nocardioides sp. DS6]|uniref:ATP synthase protein I n=1 Tax=Nocardioides eburneus TaxID=3231482 RepID=A0ABV3T1F5_9ACTN